MGKVAVSKWSSSLVSLMSHSWLCKMFLGGVRAWHKTQNVEFQAKIMTTRQNICGNLYVNIKKGEMLFSIHQNLMRSGKHVSRLDKQDTEHPLLSRVLPSPTNRQTESNFGTDLSSSQIRSDCGPELNWAAELREAHSLKSPNNLANTQHWKSLALITEQNTLLNLQHKYKQTHLRPHRSELSLFFLTLFSLLSVYRVRNIWIHGIPLFGVGSPKDSHPLAERLKDRLIGRLNEWFTD